MYQSNNTESSTRRKWLTGAIIILSFIAYNALFDGLSGKQLQEKTPTTSLPPSHPEIGSATPDVSAAITRQSSDGISPEQMDQYFLERLGEWLAARVNQKAETPVKPEGVYVEVDGKKLAVIRLRTEGVASGVYIIGIQTGELVRVSCIANPTVNVAVTTGPCADKIAEAFGIRFQIENQAQASAQPFVPTLQAAPAAQAAAESSAFIRKAFDGDVTIEVPKNWQWMDVSNKDALNTASEAIADSAGFDAKQGNNRILLAGNAVNDNRQTVATVRLSVRSGTEGGQADMRNGLKESQTDVRATLLVELERIAVIMRKIPAMRYYRPIDTHLNQNDSLVCIWSSIEYDNGHGPTIFDSWICPLGNQTLKLTTSYQKSMANLYAPTVAYIWKSLRASGS